VAEKREKEARAAGQECFKSLGAILKLHDECHALRTELGPEEHKASNLDRLGTNIGSALHAMRQVRAFTWGSLSSSSSAGGEQ
jgi:hypothetical protein